MTSPNSGLPCFVQEAATIHRGRFSWLFAALMRGDPVGVWVLFGGFVLKGSCRALSGSAGFRYLLPGFCKGFLGVGRLNAYGGWFQAQGGSRCMITETRAQGAVSRSELKLEPRKEGDCAKCSTVLAFRVRGCAPKFSASAFRTFSSDGLEPNLKLQRPQYLELRAGLVRGAMEVLCGSR